MKKPTFLTVILLLSISNACTKKDEVAPDATNPDWTAASHSNDVTPDYATMFPQNQVNTLEITVGKANWEAIKADMAAKGKGTFGAGGTSTGGGANPPMGGGNGAAPSFGEDANYVPVTLTFNGKQWFKVGYRPKGNSTLSSTWRAGIYKFPFRLKLDEFEDQYPSIKNQRIYGFKELSFSAGVKDNSLIREKVTADIFRMAGIPAAQTAFYKVYVDFGEGKKYCGVYTMVEVIDDSMVKTQFGQDAGNIYKPESNFTSFVQGQFEKKNNKTTADWSDVQQSIAALNSNLRTSNASQWRSNLEAVFNMEHFIKWLAVNTTLVNWDSYGGFAHNYYLYNHSTQKLLWIPWDHNEALTSTERVPLSLTGVASTWPLIRYVADDPVYYAKYKQYVREFSSNVFTTSKMNELFERNTTLISPFVNGTEKEVAPYTNLNNLSSFTAALSTLKQHVATRNQVVNNFLK